MAIHHPVWLLTRVWPQVCACSYTPPKDHDQKMGILHKCSVLTRAKIKTVTFLRQKGKKKGKQPKKDWKQGISCS